MTLNVYLTLRGARVRKGRIVSLYGWQIRNGKQVIDSGKSFRTGKQARDNLAEVILSLRTDDFLVYDHTEEVVKACAHTKLSKPKSKATVGSRQARRRAS